MSDILGAILSTDLIALDITPQWGIFLNGDAVVVAEQVTSFSYKQDYPLSTYPVEQGAFETYDKVQLPFEPRVQFATGGTESDRQALLDSIDAIAGDLNLYDVVTPEAVYLSCNVMHYDYERVYGAGAGRIKANVYLMQVRVTASAQFNSATPITNAKSPSAQDGVNDGAVQAQTPNQRVQSDFSQFPSAGN